MSMVFAPIGIAAKALCIDKETIVPIKEQLVA